LALFAGQTAGTIDTIPGAGDRVADIIRSACEALERLSGIASAQRRTIRGPSRS
jgi:hypothetical protein